MRDFSQHVTDSEPKQKGWWNELTRWANRSMAIVEPSKALVAFVPIFTTIGGAKATPTYVAQQIFL